MPATSVPSALHSDKALMRQIAAFDDELETCESFLEVMKTAAAKGPVLKAVATLRRRMKATLEQGDKKVIAKELAALGQDAKKAADDASAAMSMEICDRCKALWAKARGLLAQALVEVGALEPKALRLPLQKEQAQLRARLDVLEQETNKGLATVVALEELLPQADAFLKRVAAVVPAGQWMRSVYMPLVARTEAALGRVPAERCRKSLLAEIDFIDVETNKALLKGDIRAVQSRAVPQLQRLEKLAAQIVAASPALDRELARLAQRVTAGSPLAKKLKAMVEAKAKTWPSGADADAIVNGMAKFDAELAKLAAEIAGAARSAVAA